MGEGGPGGVGDIGDRFCYGAEELRQFNISNQPVWIETYEGLIVGWVQCNEKGEEWDFFGAYLLFYENSVSVLVDDV